MKIFRIVNLCEGISWLLLLFIAMPLKYLAHWPLGVQVMGRIHGALFVLFAITLTLAAVEQRWKPGRVAIVFLASLFPFGAFYVERRQLTGSAEPKAT